MDRLNRFSNQILPKKWNKFSKLHPLLNLTKPQANKFSLKLFLLFNLQMSSKPQFQTQLKNP
jgi:hypothetical protein